MGADKSVAEAEQLPQVEDAEPALPDWYRGQLNDAYREWHEGGRPADPTHPLTTKLLFEAKLFAWRTVKNAVGNYNLYGLVKPLADDRMEGANASTIARCLTKYDPENDRGARFTTYLMKAIMNDVWKEVRRAKKVTLQAALLSAYNGDALAASWWINYERTEWEAGGDKLVTFSNIAEKDRPLAHWLLEQDPHTKMTWRHVLSAFPDYRSEDRACRALKRIKRAVEKAFSRP